MIIISIQNWGKFKVEITGVPSWTLPQFGIGASPKLKHQCPKLDFAPVQNLGKFEVETPVPQLDHCPSLKLGKIEVGITGTPS